MPPKRSSSASGSDAKKQKTVNTKASPQSKKSQPKSTLKTKKPSDSERLTPTASKTAKTTGKERGDVKSTKSKSVSLDELPTTAPANSWLYRLILEPGWKNSLIPCFHTDKFKQMETWLDKEFSKEEVFPAKELIFNAFNLTPYDQVKVVILGQDPYHDDGQAHGLSFSVPKGIALPPSLKNIYKELETDLAGFKRPDHGCLEKWAREGVLLLNAALTVQAHKPNSHARCGWWEFTDNVIRVLDQRAKPMVFILWGNWAHKKESLIDTAKHRVIKTAHPSPLSFNKFSGCKCFSKANDALKTKGLKPIDWKID